MINSIGSDQTIPGYAEFDLEQVLPFGATADWTMEQWQADYEATGKWLNNFIGARDPFVILAKTAFQHIAESASKIDSSSNNKLRQFPPIQQSDVELVQALLLSGAGSPKSTPTSPHNFIRFWPQLGRYSNSFIHKQPAGRTQSKISQIISMRVRLQTAYFRNSFGGLDCEQTVGAILSRCDQQAIEAFGFSLSELFSALVRVADLVLKRIRTFAEHRLVLLMTPSKEQAVASIEFFRAAYPCASKSWRSGYSIFERTKT